jgi:DNA (cytosine-5)-methyltransferase 1
VTGEDRHGLVSTFLEQANTGMVGHSAESRCRPSSGAARRSASSRRGCRPSARNPVPGAPRCCSCCGASSATRADAEWADPLGTLDARPQIRPRRGDGGEAFEIADIGLRMLSVRELFRAQTFPADYVIDRDIKDRPINTTQATLMCGNAVPPLMAKLLYQGNVPRSAAKETREAA